MIELCCLCNEPTGRAGRSEDSIYLVCLEEPVYCECCVPPEPSIVPGQEAGPLCPGCYQRLLTMGYVFDE